MTITSTEIAVALGRPVPEAGSTEDQQWAMWISDAQRLIRHRLGDLTLLDQEDLDYVVREAVVAQVRRPDDATTVDVRVDDGAVAKTYRSSAGRVTIRDEWWDILSPGLSSGGAFSIKTMDVSSAHLPWCTLMQGADYCSCGVDIAGFPIFEAPETW